MSEKKKPEFRYLTIESNPVSDEAKAAVEKLIWYLVEGWHVLSAAGVGGGVHYIISDTATNETTINFTPPITNIVNENKKADKKAEEKPTDEPAA